MAKVIVKRGRANPLWHGHPWLYSGAIASEEGVFAPGDVVDVCDVDGRFIGRGFANARSQIRVRLVTRKDEPVDRHLIARRVDEAIALRRRLALPSEETTTYRLVNAEGDGLPGAIVDLYGDVAAVQFTALGMKRLERDLFDTLLDRLSIRSVVEISAGGVTQIEGFGAATRTVRGPEVSTVLCKENGLQFEVEPLTAQKTGLFLDQRVNRRRIRDLARGARVLDVYTYAGGFALAALAGGAVSATCVDSSGRALARAKANAERNRLGPLDAVEADAFRLLEQLRPRSFDIVIIDPPKFARAKRDLPAALKGYGRLNTLAMNACAPDGLLATCSCSQNVSEEEFERMIANAAQAAGRRVQLLEITSQGPDHPVLPAFPEGRYLKFVLCRVG